MPMGLYTEPLQKGRKSMYGKLLTMSKRLGMDRTMLGLLRDCYDDTQLYRRFKYLLGLD